MPALYWLSGLTCTDDNARTKVGMQRYAEEQGIALIFPDTSPLADKALWKQYDATDPNVYLIMMNKAIVKVFTVSTEYPIPDTQCCFSLLICAYSYFVINLSRFITIQFNTGRITVFFE